MDVPPGDVKIAIEHGPVEIVSFPMKHGDFPYSYVKFPKEMPVASAKLWHFAIENHQTFRSSN